MLAALAKAKEVSRQIRIKMGGYMRRIMGRRSRNGAGSDNPIEETENVALGTGSQQGTELEGELGRTPLKASGINVKYLDEQWESHWHEFQRFGELDDIDRAIEYATRAIDSTPVGDPQTIKRHNNLGVSYDDRFRRLGQLGDLEKAIEHVSRAIALTPHGHPSLALRRHNLGNFYCNRFKRLGGLSDLEMTIEQYSRALELTPDDHPHLSYRHDGLGMSYSHRFQRLGELHDLENSLKHKSRAIELTPDGDPDLPGRYANLGVSYLDRFRRIGETHGLITAIEYHSTALELTPDGHPDLFNRHARLGVAYSDRFKHLGELHDLERAIEHDYHALELTPDHHLDLLERHANLGSAHVGRFKHRGELHDLERAIEHFSRALELTPDDHPTLSLQHANLGMSYGSRYKRLGELHDLDSAIKHESRAVELIPNDHPDVPLWHANLGVSYNDRFERLGELNDLERAIEHESHALKLTPKDHPDLPDRHVNLGAAYRSRFKRLGELHDLGMGIEHASLALKLTSASHPALSGRHASLGAAYSDRFERLRELHDLEMAVEHTSHALKLTPAGHPDLSHRHAKLGVSYGQRFERLGEPNDLEMAIEHDSLALELTPPGHPDLSDRHDNLGVSYSYRYQHLGELHDLEAAVEHNSRALELTPDGHPDLPNRYINRADAFVLRYRHTNDHAHLQNSLDFYRLASHLSTGSPRKAFQNALKWAKHSVVHSPLNSIEAYQTTIDLLPQFIWLGATTTQRYQDLSTIENLAINAANAAILHSDPSLALEWLEHARCVVWGQTLMLRSPLEQLQSSDPNLSLRLQTVSKQLHEVSSQSFIPQTLASVPANWELIGRNRRRLAKEYIDLLSEARELPGFKSFLKPMKANQLVHVARYGPIVVINCHEDRCDALVILPGEGGIHHLPLPNFSAKDARSARSELEASLRRKGLRERGVKVVQSSGQKDQIESVLLGLWIYIAKPILNFLGLIENVSSDNLPHLTWCPTGVLSFLPLHAAGDYGQPRSRVFDYAVSSYVPTLTSLTSPLVSASSSLKSTLRLLAIGQANTPGCTPLPGTARELAYVKTHAQNNAQYSELIGDQAAITTVLDEMEKHDWVHLACHAHQNVEDPTKSGFYLHDGTLDLASINRRSLKKKGLAFLSACQTATGDEKLPDEAIHLASGMLMAGYTSVVATMWSVSDADAPLVADKVYAQLMNYGKLGNGEVGRALHNAVAKLREKVGENAFSRWVPYIHIGS